MDMTVVFGRLLPYWLTILTSLWILAYVYLWISDQGWTSYYDVLALPLVSKSSQNVVDWGADLVGLLGLSVVTSCLCTLLLTNHTLPVWRFTWLNKIFSFIRHHDDISLPRRLGRLIGRILTCVVRQQTDDADYGLDIAKKNQFALGDPNFNLMAIWLIVLPFSVTAFGYLPSSMRYADEYAVEKGVSAQQLRWEYTSYMFGWASTLCLVFFLIPVSRHSVLLAAMGWSPVHALRIHIWAGYLSFIYMLIHGIILVAVWFVFYNHPVWKQVIPARQCWAATWVTDDANIEATDHSEPSCDHVFWNWTGILAAIFFIILWGSSLNWVRRRNYRMFYILHVIFGTLTLLGTVLHMQFFALYLIPSMTYYLASTAPTLIQALASQFRGGIKIRKVVAVQDSGGCVEVHFQANEQAKAQLNKEPCLYIKLCVPKVSLVWHPFDVYYHHEDSETVRFMFRPVGPFSKQLAQLLTSPQRPLTLVDGFYRGADRSEQATQHDCVTIVAGGVAITPFLTLIPAICNRVRDACNTSVVKTKTLVVHWVCREVGLCHYIVENHLGPLIASASDLLHITDFQLTVYVYLTGKKRIESEDLAPLESSRRFLSSRDMTKDDLPDVEHTEAVLEEASSNASSTSTYDPDMDKAVTFASERGDDFSNAGRLRDASSVDNGHGHALELARVMPGRYSVPIWNVPYFLAFSMPCWFGFWYIFSHYNSVTSSYYELSELTWITMYCILTFFAFAIFVEVTVLVLRKYWPQPKLDAFDVVQKRISSAAVPCKVLDGDCDTGVINECGTSWSDNTSLVYREGRPTPDQLFEHARMAEAPGIFMCGPSALTQLVKSEAGKENSYLCLTRFCLYEEPSEM